MSRPKVLLPTTLDIELSTSEVEAVPYSPTLEIPTEHLDADAIVVWGMPDKYLLRLPRLLPDVKMVQLLSAGADVALQAGFSPEVQICNGRGLHDGPVAEHALALLLAAARGIPTLARAQIGHRWAKELGGIQPISPVDRFSTLRGAQVTIWGYGSIGHHLAKLLEPLGANVVPVASAARQEADTQIYGPEQLPEILPSTDALVMILPSSAATYHALDSHLLDLMPKKAWLVNVGRGSTVDESALIGALKTKRIAGAALDVTEIEPLPVNSALWDLPNVLITPHAAGGRPIDADQLVDKNIRNWLNKKPLINQVK